MRFTLGFYSDEVGSATGSVVSGSASSFSMSEAIVSGVVVEM